MKIWRDYYQILDVNQNASQEEIKAAYRYKVAVFHPDKLQHLPQRMQKLAEEDLKKINEAFDVLKNPEKRASYDSEWLEKNDEKEESFYEPEPETTYEKSPYSYSPPPPPPSHTSTTSESEKNRWTPFLWLVAVIFIIFLIIPKSPGRQPQTSQVIPHSKQSAQAETKIIQEQTLAGKELIFPTAERAKEIMGNNFLGVDDAIKYFQINASDKDLKTFEKIPFSEKTLILCKNDYILVADFGISFFLIRKMAGERYFNESDPAVGGWYNYDESFTKMEDNPQWRLVRKNAPLESFMKNWKEQKSVIKKNEDVPKIRDMVYVIMLYHSKNGERLFQNVYINCRSADSWGFIIDTGGFDENGLKISSHVDAPEINIGLAISRKPER